MIVGLPLMKNIPKPLAKSVFIPSGLIATDAAIQKRLFISGTTALIISNEDIDKIMKTVKSLK